MAEKPDFLDRVRDTAAATGRSVAQLAVNRAIQQKPGFIAAFRGAKRSWQIQKTAGATNSQRDERQQERLRHALLERGEAVVLLAA